AIARALWGRGLMTEAVGRIVTMAFEADAGLARLRSSIDRRNLASARVLEKLGLRCEGVLRANSFDRYGPVDEARFGILRAEYDARRRSGEPR
ncbi:MAG: GNAT family N-acetyltransferase, partial [Deltaproteobacteria bacterium]|nr:GNAT family N-acetyltransferase [Nannocystaceae bacterium]